MLGNFSNDGLSIDNNASRHSAPPEEMSMDIQLLTTEDALYRILGIEKKNTPDIDRLQAAQNLLSLHREISNREILKNAANKREVKYLLHKIKTSLTATYLTNH